MDQICLRSIFFLRVLLLRVNGAPDCASVVGPVGCAPLFVSNRGHRALIPDASVLIVRYSKQLKSYALVDSCHSKACHARGLAGKQG